VLCPGRLGDRPDTLDSTLVVVIVGQHGLDRLIGPTSDLQRRRRRQAFIRLVHRHGRQHPEPLAPIAYQKSKSQRGRMDDVLDATPLV
jgi:hypothetical protein